MEDSIDYLGKIKAELVDALEALDKARPEKPLEFLSQVLAQRSVTVEGASPATNRLFEAKYDKEGNRMKTASRGLSRDEWRQQKEDGLNQELTELLSEDHLEIACNVVELFARRADFGRLTNYPKYSREWKNRSRFRKACMLWLKPGKLPTPSEVAALQKRMDVEELEACGIRTMRNRKKKWIPFTTGSMRLDTNTNLLTNRGLTANGDTATVSEINEDGSEVPSSSSQHVVDGGEAKAAGEEGKQSNGSNSSGEAATAQKTYAERRKGKAAAAASKTEVKADVEETIAHAPSTPLPPTSSSSSSSSSSRSSSSSPTPASSTPALSSSSSSQPSAPSSAAAAGASSAESSSFRPSSRDPEEEMEEAKEGEELDLPRVLSASQPCYICKHHFAKLHHFYDRMCTACGNFNYAKRSQTADLRGKVAIVTGGRVKIGYEIVLILLRAGATVLCTTRFPRNALMRFATEPDLNEWKSRLHVYALDLRVLPEVEMFVAFVKQHYPRLDMIINNAAQTIRRPPAFYAHMIAAEAASLPQITQAAAAAGLGDIADCLREFRPEAQATPAVRIHEITQALTNQSTPLPAPPSQPSASSSSSSSSSEPAHWVEDELLGQDDDEDEEEGKGDGGEKKPRHLVPAAAAATKHSPTAATMSMFGGGPGGRLGELVVGVMGSSQLSPAAMTQVPLLPEDFDTSEKHFPVNETDENDQQIDQRPSTTWVKTLEEVSTVEAAEVHVINALAPFVLNSKLKSFMAASGDPCWIVNVSSMEGRFANFKDPVHPHTNMAKAALNMMTCTSAKDYAASRIFMNSVDTGWVTEENPTPIALRKLEAGFAPPLDEIDGAARVLDPIFNSILTGNYEFGKFFKDYKRSGWEY